ncbi:YeeE/YedE family protein [Jinshanibacter sp. LJY008]|uniref:YeeE/YedE family protein n=1 Tax=Limnobaculum eriocheiris TaxID=2897391 RepID=A0A9X1SLN1_9GAMM|nr:YeeE/YedE family protein [Limnobaculum eriocheiris]MCD1127010.1 YeeE/YedE family protein [Limnobaculum eriocheiris]
MNIAWDAFSPVTALVGGVLIGVAAALLIVFNGRIAGISGILANVIRGQREGLGWRSAFLLGIIASSLFYTLLQPMPDIRIVAEWPALVVAGLLVGIGTRYGSGCTSGHGVCGLPRLSFRSLIATLTFMATGVVTVLLFNPLQGG